MVGGRSAGRKVAGRSIGSKVAELHHKLEVRGSRPRHTPTPIVGVESCVAARACFELVMRWRDSVKLVLPDDSVPTTITFTIGARAVARVGVVPARCAGIAPHGRLCSWASLPCCWPVNVTPDVIVKTHHHRHTATTPPQPIQGEWHPIKAKRLAQGVHAGGGEHGRPASAARRRPGWNPGWRMAVEMLAT